MTYSLGTQQAPVVSVAPADSVFLDDSLALSATVSDDGLPTAGTLTTLWSKLAGPGDVVFSDDSALTTTATFSQAGYYELQLSADDGELVGTDTVRVVVVDPNAPQPASVHFAAVGDFGGNSAESAAVAAMVSSWNPDFVVTMGDNRYGADIDAEVGQYYSEFIGSYQGTYGKGSPLNRFFPAPGNHDYSSPGGFTTYLDYFTLPGGGVTTSGASNTERYYDFIRGPVHFFVVDSNQQDPDGIVSTSVQAHWLETQMAASTSPWNVVVLHHPPFSSGFHGPTSNLQWPFEAWGADVVMAGHEHSYERIMDGGSFPYVVNGSGGKALRGVGAKLDPDSVLFDATNHGAMIIDACARRMEFEFRGVSGAVVDSFALGADSCDAPPIPVGLAVSSMSSSELGVSWGDVSGEDSFELTVSSTGVGGPFVPVSGSPFAADTSSASVAELVSATEYCFEVQASTAGIGSGFSSPVCASTLPVAPPVPSGLAVSVMSATALTVAWTDVPGETSYQLEVGPSAGPFVAVAGSPLTAGTVSYPASGLTTGVEYCFRVQASNTVGPSGFSTPVCATPVTGGSVVVRIEDSAPEMVFSTGWKTKSSSRRSGSTSKTSSTTGASVSAGFQGPLIRVLSTTGPTLGQALVSIDGGAPVKVEMYAPKTGYQVPVFEASALSPGPHTITVTVAGTKNAKSTAKNVDVDALEVAVAQSSAPPVISGLNVAVTATTASVSWRTDVIATSKVNYGLTNTYGATVTNPTAVASPQLSLTGLVCNTTYHYKITSTASPSGVIGTSNDATFTTAACTLPVAPPVPSGLAVGVVSATALGVSWTDVSGETSYQLEVGPSAGPFVAVTGSPLTAGTVSYPASGLTTGVEYCFRLQASNPVGPSGFSTPVCATPVTGASVVVRIEESAPAMLFSAGWTTKKSSRRSGGTSKMSNTTGASVSAKFQGPLARLLSTTGPTYGQAMVSIDSGTPVKVDL